MQDDGEDGDLERRPLLSSPQHHGKQQLGGGASSASGGGAAGAGASSGAWSQSASLPTSSSYENLQCRICLEEDDACALEAPCRCTGTQRYAHSVCINRWIAEKRSGTCEICGAEYAFPSYTPPPPPLPGPPPGHGASASLARLTREEQEALQRILFSLAAQGSDGTGDVLRRRPVPYEAVQPSYSFTATLATCVLILLLLHGSLDDGGRAAAAAAAAGGAGAGGIDAGAAAGAAGAAAAAGGLSPHGGPLAPGAAGAALAAGLLLVVVWLVGKLFLIVVPLLLVMRLCRGEETEDGASPRSPWYSSQQHHHTGASGAQPSGAAGTPHGSGGPPGRDSGDGDNGSTGGGEGIAVRGGADLQRGASGLGGRHPFVVALRALQHHQLRAVPRHTGAGATLYRHRGGGHAAHDGSGGSGGVGVAGGSGGDDASGPRIASIV